MKVFYWSMILGLLMSACKVKIQENETTEVVEEQSDSTTVSDVSNEFLIEQEEKIPQTVDESFIDFIYSFTRNEKIQESRIIFPLPNYTHNEKILLEKEDWQFDPLFTEMDTYTNIHESNYELEIDFLERKEDTTLLL